MKFSRDEALALLDTLFATSPVGLAFLDCDLQYVRVNEALAAMHGLPVEAHLGRHIAEVLPHRAAELVPRLARVLATSEPEINAEVSGDSLAAPGGSRHWLVSRYPVRAPDGEVLGLGIVASDITQQKKLEEALRESEQRYRTLAEASPTGIWRADASGRVFDFNEQCRDFLGMPPESLCSDGWHRIIHPEDLPKTLERWAESVSTGLVFESEYRVIRWDGAHRWMMARAFPVRDPSGQLIAWTGSCTDIDDLKRAQQALSAADRHKNAFLAMLGHELRTPLGTIHNVVAILRRVGSDPAALATQLETIQRQVDHMTRLTDDLLDLSRLASGKLLIRPERLDLAALVREVARDHETVLTAVPIELEISLPDAPIWVEGDPTRLAQVVGNLLQNAAKFSDANGRVTVTLERGDVACLTISDTGAGIPEHALPHVFVAFAQAEPDRDRMHGGLGLGLALVKGFVTLHGGSVDVESEGVGRGSRFTVRLPTNDGQPTKRRDGETERRRDGDGGSDDPCREGRGARRILIIESDGTAATSLRLLLERWGYEVAVAPTIGDGIAAAERFGPGIVMCDLDRSGADGRAITTALRPPAGTSGRSLVALSRFSGEEDRRRARAVGFDRHLTKPILPSKLERLLAELHDSGP